jgi:hypothetical protein
MKRVLALLLCIATIGAAHPSKTKVKKTVGQKVLPIAIVLNGTKLEVNPGPVFYKDHLLVPVRRILTALGLSFDKSGSTVRTYAGAKTISLHIGSTLAQVDDREVQLDAPPVEIKNALYAPLRFFTSALGAQAVFNRQTNSVDIVSTLMGRSGTGITTMGGGVQMMGTITAVDLDSDPPTITLTYGGSVRTLSIRSDVNVLVQDVNAGTYNAGDLSQMHAGDYAQVNLDKSGAIKRIVDAYGSRTGTVAAVAAGQLVLDDGHVIAPSRETTITLNGSNATVDQIRVGDDVMVRYNIDSSEPRQIIATRKSSGVATAQGPATISGIDIEPVHPLRQGQKLYVTMRGTPGGLAAYDIGPYVTNQQLTESQPGVYTGSYTIPRGVNFARAPIFGHLNVHGSDAPQAESAATATVSTEPPSIVDFAPDNGTTVNNSRPSIYATFSSGTVDVNSSTERLEVNGHDVTSSSTRSARFIYYTPGVDVPRGPVHVTVWVSDAAGNTAKRSWTFFVGGR